MYVVKSLRYIMYIPLFIMCSQTNTARFERIPTNNYFRSRICVCCNIVLVSSVGLAASKRRPGLHADHCIVICSGPLGSWIVCWYLFEKLMR